MKIITKLSILLIFMIFTSCVDQYALQTNTFEDAIVVEGTITNELKYQEIAISRTFKFEDEVPTFETNATVYITDEANIQINFHESDNKYVSDNEFKAMPNKMYQLHIFTQDGKEYTSTTQPLTTQNDIQNIATNVTTNQFGEKGVEIVVNSFDPTNSSKYYRYEYEETYKVTVPKWVQNDLNYNAATDDFFLSPRDVNTKTCYSFEKSNSIIQTSTNNLTEDRVMNFPVRFIKSSDYIIADRYSILVKQYVQNLESYNYYKALNEVSSSADLLSQIQPGFFQGNLKCVTNPNEKVIGFFSVSTVSSQRIFFNYVNVFPNDPIPNFFDDCEILEYDISINLPAPDCSPKCQLIKYLDNNSILYYSNSGPVYNMVIPACGDCTSFSSNIRPLFWTD